MNILSFIEKDTEEGWTTRKDCTFTAFLICIMNIRIFSVLYLNIGFLWDLICLLPSQEIFKNKSDKSGFLGFRI